MSLAMVVLYDMRKFGFVGMNDRALSRNKNRLKGSYYLMKKSRICALLITVSVIISLAILIIIFVVNSAEYYCKKCLNSNATDFDNLVTYVKQNEITGKMSIGDGIIPKEIEEILERLNGKYQMDSHYPVFTTINVRSDGNGNTYIYIQAKKQRIITGDGINKPDIRCYSLVYIDPNYAGSIKEMSERPFYDNWRIWSEDMWSG